MRMVRMSKLLQMVRMVISNLAKVQRARKRTHWARQEARVN